MNLKFNHLNIIETLKKCLFFKMSSWTIYTNIKILEVSRLFLHFNDKESETRVFEKISVQKDTANKTPLQHQLSVWGGGMFRWHTGHH